MTKRKLPVGIQSFEKIIRDNYLYIDKTEYIWRLIQTGSVYFLSRPRRFGKSLLISTMEAYFLGKKDLFRGLAIETLEQERGEDAWTEYPVITFSLSGGEYQTETGLSDMLSDTIRQYTEQYGLPADNEIECMTLPVRFRNLIRSLYDRAGRQVVVLVDEYDKPLLETMLVNVTQEERNRQLYKGFFSVLKDMDQYLKFVFFTGVTKFSKVSIFSDLNQLEDISLLDEYAGICGITQQELLENLDPEIRGLAAKQNIRREECIRELADMYDGYHFSAAGEGVYNPFSLLRALKNRKTGQYWFETGTPTFLVRKLEQSDYMIEDYSDGILASETDITDYREDNPDPVPLFYQTGYLTILGWNEEYGLYKLSFPNREVKYGFLKSLLPDLFHTESSQSSIAVMRFLEDLKRGDIHSFLTRLQSLFAGIPYPEGAAPRYEREWRNQIYLVFALLGQNVQCEVHTAHGRADCVVLTKDYIYIFEFKLDQGADTALRQIREKGYTDPYQSDARNILQIGVSFSSETRNIAEWEIS